MPVAVETHDSLEPSWPRVQPPADAPRVLASIPTGFQVRQFVHSGVLAGLIEAGLAVTVVTPNGAGEGFVAELERAGIAVRSHPLRLGRFGRRYLNLRQHLRFESSQTATLRQKLKELRRRQPVTAAAAVAANRCLGFSRRLWDFTLKQEGRLLRNAAIDRLFNSERFDLVLLGSPGYLHQDAVLLHAAARRGIPTLAAILSWDNLSSKGLINPLPTRLLVWSEHMRQEAEELHGLSPQRIEEVGAIVHDAYFGVERFGSREANLRRLGLDPNRRLVFYGTNHGGFFPDEVEIVRKTAEWVENDRLGKPSQLWVRVHPQAVSGPFAVDLRPYLELRSERVRVEIPPIPNNRTLWEFPRHDLEHLVGLLRDADVVINTGSLSLEAAVLDRPVVCIAYDPAGALEYDLSARRFYDYTHMAELVRSGGIRLARSAEELRAQLAAYIEDPALDRDGRREIVRKQFGKIDGRGAQRAVEAIVRMLQPGSDASSHSRKEAGS